MLSPLASKLTLHAVYMNWLCSLAKLPGGGGPPEVEYRVNTIPPLVLIVILRYWDPCIDTFQGSISSESCSLPTLSDL